MRGVVVVAVLAAGCGKHAASSGDEVSPSFLGTATLRDVAFQLGEDDNVTIELTLADKAGKPIQRLPGAVSVEVELDGGENMMCKAVTSIEGNALDEKGHIKLVTSASHVTGGPCNHELLAAGFSGPASWHIRASYMGYSTENAVKVASFTPSGKQP